MFDSISNYENKFYLLNKEVLGIDSIDLSYSNSANISKILGRDSGFTTINGPISQQLSVSRNLIYIDEIYNYTNGDALYGQIEYVNNKTSYGFSSGYLTDYIVNCAVGSIPKISTNFIIFDEMQQMNVIPSIQDSDIIFYIPNQGSISLSCDNSSTNRVIGFDYSIKINKKPIYIIGFTTPYQVVTISPLQYSASVQIDVDDAFLQNSLNFLSNRQNRTLSFSIKDKTLATELLSVSMPNASLVSESLSSSADGGVKLTLNYIGHS